MKLFNFFLFLSLSLIFACEAKANPLDQRAHDAHLCWNNTIWQRTSKIHTTIESQSLNIKGEVDFSMFENYDMAFKFTRVENGGKQQYNLWVIEGRSLLSEDKQLKEGYEIDFVDDPALTYQLALAIISLATEKLPSELNKNYSYTIGHSTLPIKTTTPSASGLYNAPWDAQIELSKTKNESINFEINFIYSSDNEKDNEIRFHGEIFKVGDLLQSPLTDSLDISNWYQYKIGPFTKVYEGGTIYDYGATPYENKAQTLGELRTMHEKK